MPCPLARRGHHMGTTGLAPKPETRFVAVRGQIPTHPLQGMLGGSSSAGVKDKNDDAIVGKLPTSAYETYAKGIVACVADGISGSANSHLAAQTSVIQFTQDYYAAPESWPVQDCAGRLMAALNTWFYSQNRSGSPAAEGQVTTFTAIIARSTTAHIVHIGDTRVLRIRGNEIMQLTEDHTAAFLGRGDTLSRALGVEPHVRVDYLQEPLQEGDLYLLMSDGVHGVLSPQQMRDLLAARPLTNQPEVEDAARRICDAALAAGSDDNVSCLILKITQLPSESLTEAHHRLTSQVIPPVMQPGNRIDGFQVDRVLHSSTRSHVYLVHQQGEDRQLVLKAPSQNFAEDLQYLEAFTLEQWVGRRIDNPQVMKILPYDDSRFLYYVAEWVEGETLRDWMIHNPKASLDQVVEVLGSVISAVRIFHRLGMVHRDLKPENIILGPDARAKVIDFGAVQVSGFADNPSGYRGSAPEGSLDYIAPEVLNRQPATNLSDMFSIGAMTYEMLTGHLPFGFSDGTKLPSRPSDWAIKPLEQHRPDLPAAADRALARCLAFEVNDRPDSMSEFLADMKRAARSRSAQSMPSVPLLERGSTSFWRGWAMIATLSTLILAGLLLLG